MGITIPLSKVQKRVAEATRVSRRTLCCVLKEGENVETGVTMRLTTMYSSTGMQPAMPEKVESYSGWISVVYGTAPT